MPVERAQRLSTVASAANAMQLALSLSAVLPGQGLNVGAGAAYQETAIGTVDALERAPLVIGFADRVAEQGHKATGLSNNRARFGWLFGPPIRVDTQNNRLVHRHIVANHRVLADISVPAWWPSVTLKVRSAWIGNWADGSEHWVLNDRYMEDNATAGETDCGKRLAKLYCQSVSVDLPRSSADLHALSGMLARKNLQQPLRVPKIDRISPRTVSVCAETVELFVYGVDLWQGPPVANLRGLAASEVNVLPNMAGLAVKFDIKDLPPHPNPGTPDTLWIVTQNGQVGDTVTIKGKKSEKAKDCGHKAPPAAALQMALASPPILNHATGTKLSFRVAEGKLTQYHKLAARLETVNDKPTLTLSEPLKFDEKRKKFDTEKVKFDTNQAPGELEGRPVVASVLLFDNPNVVERKARVIAKDIPMVLCKADCKIALAKDTVEVADEAAQIEIEIVLPQGFGRVFDGLGPDTSPIAAYIDDKDEDGNTHRIELASTKLTFPDSSKNKHWRSKGVHRLKGKLTPPKDADDAARYKKLIATSGGANLTLKWDVASGVNVPAMDKEKGYWEKRDLIVKKK